MRKRRPAAKPLYLAIEDHVLDLIAGPDYGPGDKIPSERQLADALGANRMTVRKAIDLAGPGDLVLLLGKGHENSIIYRDRTIVYDEIEEARSALRERGFGGKK